jgi:hypothetical protein
MYDLTIWNNNHTILGHFRNYLCYIHHYNSITYTSDDEKTSHLFVHSRIGLSSRAFNKFVQSMEIIQKFATRYIRTYITRSIQTTLQDPCGQLQELDIITPIEPETTEHKCIYIVSTSSYTDVRETSCTIFTSKDCALVFAFESVEKLLMPHEIKPEINEYGYYPLNMYMITTHCGSIDDNVTMTNIFNKPILPTKYSQTNIEHKIVSSKLSTSEQYIGNVHIVYDVNTTDIFAQRKPFTPKRTNNHTPIKSDTDFHRKIKYEHELHTYNSPDILNTRNSFNNSPDVRNTRHFSHNHQQRGMYGSSSFPIYNNYDDSDNYELPYATIRRTPDTDSRECDTNFWSTDDDSSDVDADADADEPDILNYTHKLSDTNNNNTEMDDDIQITIVEGGDLITDTKISMMSDYEEIKWSGDDGDDEFNSLL